MGQQPREGEALSLFSEAPSEADRARPITRREVLEVSTTRARSSSRKFIHPFLFLASELTRERDNLIFLRH